MIYWLLEGSGVRSRYELGEAEETEKPVFWASCSNSERSYLSSSSLLCVTFYSAVFPFRTFAIKFFIQEFHGMSA